MVSLYPILTNDECTTFIIDCKNLLKNKGLFYLSFVAGDSEKSGYQTGSSGDKVYFNYHKLNVIINELENNSFKILQTVEKDYPKSKRKFEKHTILIAQLY